MMKKRILSWLMAVTMILAMIPAAALPAFAAGEEAKTGVKFDLVDVGSNAYKLVFSVKTPDTIMFTNTLFSFDNTLIQPVRRNNFGTDVVPVNEDNSSGGYQIAFQVVARDSDLEDPFTAIYEGWRINGIRTCFNYGTFTTSYLESNGIYKPIFEFYFRLKDGKAAADITATTFRFENGKDAENFVAVYNPSGDTAGLRINSTTIAYVWGCNNQTVNPDTIGEVINPFAIGEPDKAVDIAAIAGVAAPVAGAAPVTAITETEQYTGTVTWISEKSEFTPKNIQTKDDRENLVYAVKIAIENDGYVKIGMYGEMLLNEK